MASQVQFSSWFNLFFPQPDTEVLPSVDMFNLKRFTAGFSLRSKVGYLRIHIPTLPPQMLFRYNFYNHERVKYFRLGDFYPFKKKSLKKIL